MQYALDAVLQCHTALSSRAAAFCMPLHAPCITVSCFPDQAKRPVTLSTSQSSIAPGQRDKHTRLLRCRRHVCNIWRYGSEPGLEYCSDRRFRTGLPIVASLFAEYTYHDSSAGIPCSFQYFRHPASSYIHRISTEHSVHNATITIVASAFDQT